MTRSLSQVQIKQDGDADDVFVKRMGDVVEAGGGFIPENALSVANLAV
ncbi:MAG: hypothetical protein ACLQIQ_10665 [Beijerinckiaceae bacterium]